LKFFSIIITPRTTNEKIDTKGESVYMTGLRREYDHWNLSSRLIQSWEEEKSNCSVSIDSNQPIRNTVIIAP
jgi:hypothetical protein